MYHLKKKNYVVLCICMSVFVLTALGFTGPPFKSAHSDEEVIRTVFKNSGAQFQSLTVRGWELIELRDHSESPQVLLKQFGTKLFHSGFNLTISNASGGLNTLTIRGRAAKDVTAALTLATHTSSAESNEAYLILSLESSRPTSYSVMKDIYNKIIGDETNQSVVIWGSINRKLSPLETNTIMKKMVKSASLQNVETIAERGLVSISGYSPNVRNMLTLDGKWVNINMALRYNSLAKRTMVYVGSPVITIEY